jgi:putative adenylate-forming enzyme
MFMPDRAHALTSYVRTLALARTLVSRQGIRRYQERQSGRLVEDVRRTIPFYRDKGARFEDLPIIDKALQQSDFAAFNRVGIGLDEVFEAIGAGRETVRGFHVGQSTGTSGNRGRFVITPRERFIWLGTIVAKAVPDALFRAQRVALALPGFSTLYKSAPQGSRIRLAFFDLARGIEAWRDAFVAFKPDTIVAPPKVLRRLAEDGLITGVEAFSGAEVLDPLDRAMIERSTKGPVREIYMATEGLFGVACRHGTLHLAEDVMRFEWERVPGSTLVTPIVTDLIRRFQPMIRYRLNDLLELSERRCACGSAFQAVARVHGRMDDVFEFDGANGRITVTPDVLRNAVVDADAAIGDFRIVQKADGKVVVSLDDALPEGAHRAACVALERALARFGVSAVIESARGIAPCFDRKLRRVERERA